MLDLLHDPVGAPAQDADGLQVVGVDAERLLVDRDRRARVQVPGDGRGGGSAKQEEASSSKYNK